MISWILYTDSVVGQDHPSLSDVANRPLRNVLTDSGYAANGSDWAGFAKATHAHSAADVTSGTLATARGGTGVSSPTAGNLLIGAAAAAMTLLAPGAAGGYVRSDGSTWARSALLASDLSGTVAVANGGTGLTTYTAGDLVYSPSTNTVGKLAIGAANRVLTSDGALPQWSANIAYAALPSGSGAWDAGVGNTTTFTRSVTVSGTLTVSNGQTLALGTATVSGTPTWSSTQSLNTSGNAATATALQNARTLWGVSFDGTANVTAAPTFGAGATVSNGQTLALGTATVSGTPTWSSAQAITLSTAAQPNITSLGTLTSLTVTGTVSITNGRLDLSPAGGSNGIINASAAMYFNIDADTGGSEAYFWNKESTGTSGTQLMSLVEAGHLTLHLGDLVLGVAGNNRITAASAGGATPRPLLINASAVTIETGGLSVSAGITAVQAFTATTGTFSSTLLSSAAGGHGVGVGITTANADNLWIVNSGTNAGANNNYGVVQYKRGGTSLWSVGVIGSVATDGAMRWYDEVGTANRMTLSAAGVLTVTGGVYSGAGGSSIEITATHTIVFRASAGASNAWLIGATRGLHSVNATGGDKGVGTINIEADIYKNNTAYTNPDYVFEAVFTGDVKKFLDNPGARAFRDDFLSRGGRIRTIDEDRAYAREHLHLPGIGRNAAGAFDRADMALQEIETTRVYVWQLHDRITELEHGKAATVS